MLEKAQAVDFFHKDFIANTLNMLQKFMEHREIKGIRKAMDE